MYKEIIFVFLGLTMREGPTQPAWPPSKNFEQMCAQLDNGMDQSDQSEQTTWQPSKKYDDDMTLGQ